jgi:hypothetical protein
MYYLKWIKMYKYEWFIIFFIYKNNSSMQIIYFIMSYNKIGYSWMIWRYKWLILNNMVKLFYTAVVYFMDLICVHWRCNIFLQMHPIKSRHVSICWDILGINIKVAPRYDLIGCLCKNILHCQYIAINLIFYLL